MIFKWILIGTFVANYMGEDNGKYVHLYEWFDNRTSYLVSFSHTSPIDPKDVRAVKVECDKVWGVTENDTERLNELVAYTAYICNGFEVIMTDNKKVVVDKDLKEEIEQKEFDFDAVEKANAEKKAIATEERRKANQKVLKSYRIK